MHTLVQNINVIYINVLIYFRFIKHMHIYNHNINKYQIFKKNIEILSLVDNVILINIRILIDTYLHCLSSVI